MGEGDADTAAVQVDDAAVLAAGEDDALVEGVAALGVDEAGALQQIEGIALGYEMTPQAPAGGIADPQFLDQGGIVQSALFKIPQRLGVAIELLLIESGSLLEHARQGRREERFAVRGRRGFGGRTDGGTTRQSESDRRPDHSRGSKRDFCGR